MTALTPPEPAGSLGGHFAVIRGRWKVLASTLVVCLGVAAIVASRTAASYSSTAQILVSPISAADPDFVGVSALLDSTISPTTPVLTVSRLVKAPATLRIVAPHYPGTSPSALADDVAVSPLSETSIVAVTGTGSSPAAATRLADTFARATVANRAATFQRSLRSTVGLLQRRVDGLHGTTTVAERDALQARLASLAPLVGTGDPSVKLLNAAVSPAGPSSPSKSLVLGATALAALVLGVLLAFFREATDDRVRRIDQALVEAPMPRGTAVAVPVARGASSRPVPQAPLRRLVTRLLLAPRGRDAGSIAVVGVDDGGEARTATAATLTRLVAARRVAPDDPTVAVHDCPPPTTDPSSVDIARSADTVVVVAQAGRTRKRDLRDEFEILSDAGAAPTALILLQPRGAGRALARSGSSRVAAAARRLDFDRFGLWLRARRAPQPALPDLSEQLAPARARREHEAAPVLAGGDRDAA